MLYFLARFVEESWWSHTTPGNKLDSWKSYTNSELATGITSDLKAECDLKAFYDWNYFFTIFQLFLIFFWFSRATTSTATTTTTSLGKFSLNLIFTTCFTACSFHFAPICVLTLVRVKFAFSSECVLLHSLCSALPLCIAWCMCNV